MCFLAILSHWDYRKAHHGRSCVFPVPSYLTSRSRSLYLDTVWFSFYCCLCVLGLEPCFGSGLCFKESFCHFRVRTLVRPTEVFLFLTKCLVLAFIQPLHGAGRVSLLKVSWAATLFWLKLVITKCFNWWDKDWKYSLLRIEHSELRWG